jgi:site-specific DNA recombinase
LLHLDHQDEARAAIRDLVEKIIIHPAGRYQPCDLEIHGQLAALLGVSEWAAPKSVMAVVAGDGFEPPTFRL